MSNNSMFRRPSALVLSACVTAALSGGLLIAPAQAGSQQAATTLQTTLRPSGDVNGRGDATVRLNADRGRVCATITWKGIKSPQAAHIHEKSDGDVVVDVSTAVTGGKNCTGGVARGVIKEIVAHPKRYYVNVHNAVYPAGAIQGTLHR